MSTDDGRRLRFLQLNARGALQEVQFLFRAVAGDVVDASNPEWLSTQSEREDIILSVRDAIKTLREHIRRGYHHLLAGCVDSPETFAFDLQSRFDRIDSLISLFAYPEIDRSPDVLKQAELADGLCKELEPLVIAIGVAANIRDADPLSVQPKPDPVHTADEVPPENRERVDYQDADGEYITLDYLIDHKSWNSKTIYRWANEKTGCPHLSGRPLRSKKFTIGNHMPKTLYHRVDVENISESLDRKSR